VALLCVKLPQDELDQRALASAVGAHQRHPALHVQAKVHAPEERARRVVAKGHVQDLQHWRANGARVWELKLPPGVVRLAHVHDLHALQRLDPALHQRRALGVVAELVNEGLHVLAARVGGLASALGVLGALGARALKRVIVAPAQGECVRDRVRRRGD